MKLMSEKENNFFNSEFILRLIAKNRIVLLIVAVAAVLFSFLFSSPLFVTPLYKSKVVLFPTSGNSISKVLLSSTFQSKKDMLEFGEVEQTEQMLQVLNSDKVRAEVIRRFNLKEHYGIKDDQKYPLTQLNKTYDSRIKFRRTEYGAVQITVLDQNADTAALIANDIAEIFDSTMNAMQKEVAVKAFEVVEKAYMDLKNDMDKLEDSLNMMRRHGVFDYESQVEMLTQQYAIELGRGNKQGVESIEKKLDVLAEYGGAFYAITEMLDHDRLQLSLVKAKYEEAKVDATETVPHKFVVSSATPAERKSYPVVWLVVVVTTISALLMAMFALIIMERIKMIKKEDNGKSK